MFLNLYLAFAEKATNWQFGFQLAASPVMEGIMNFHHDLFFFLVVIVIFVFYFLGQCIHNFGYFEHEGIPSHRITYSYTHAPILEIIWTIIPAAILVFIAIPSFSLLYSVDEIVHALLTVKVIGHQWYWSYEFIDPDYIFNDLVHSVNDSDTIKDFFNPSEEGFVSYDSYMLPVEDLTHRSQRLLHVDNKLYVPVETNVRLLITSADVLHSWAVPALGVKLDACPGRLNQTTLFVKRPGTFYGQCSEICGINHGFMPIAVTSLDILGDGSQLDPSQSETVASLFFYLQKSKLA